MIDKTKFAGKFVGDQVPFDSLIGDTFRHVSKDSTSIFFYSTSGMSFMLGGHSSDCSIEDLCGELGWLEASPILQADESHDTRTDSDGYDREAWHYYKIATIKGYVTVRFYGCDGYYAASACLEITRDEQDVLKRHSYRVLHPDYQRFDKGGIVFEEEEQIHTCYHRSLDEAKVALANSFLSEAERVGKDEAKSQWAIEYHTKRLAELGEQRDKIEAGIKATHAIKHINAVNAATHDDTLHNEWIVYN